MLHIVITVEAFSLYLYNMYSCLCLRILSAIMFSNRNCLRDSFVEILLLQSLESVV